MGHYEVQRRRFSGRDVVGKAPRASGWKQERGFEAAWCFEGEIEKRVADGLETGERARGIDRGEPVAPIIEGGSGERVDQRLLVGIVPVERHRRQPDILGQAAHRQALDPVAVEAILCGGEDAVFRDHVYDVYAIEWRRKTLLWSARPLTPPLSRRGEREEKKRAI